MKIILHALILTFALLFGCAANYSQPATSGAPSSAPSAAAPASASGPSASAPSAAAVQISGFAFNPSTLTVAKGAKVTWTNSDNAPHTITSASGAFDSGTLQNGASWTFTFDKAGTYDYGCSIHTGMKARIIVTE